METKSCDVNRILSLTPSLLLMTLASPVIGLEIVEKKILTCCGQNRLIEGSWPWKAQKSSSPCPSFIPHPNQLVFNSTCCYCYCEVIVYFEAYLLPGKKMFLFLLQLPFLSLPLFPLFQIPDLRKLK